MKKSGFIVAGACFAACALGGCASRPGLTLRVTDVGITRQSASGMIVSFRVEAENRGDAAMPMREVRYSLDLGGGMVFEGQRSAEATVPRFGAQPIVLPVALSLGEGGDLPAAPAGRVPYVFRGSVEYEVPGTIAEVLFDSGIRRPTASIQESGDLDFSTVGP